jgi:hypothetical protein
MKVPKVDYEQNGTPRVGNRMMEMLAQKFSLALGHSLMIPKVDHDYIKT